MRSRDSWFIGVLCILAMLGAITASATDARAATPTINHTSVDLVVNTLLIRGASFGTAPSVVMGLPSGALSKLTLISKSDKSITARLPTTLSGSYKVVVTNGALSATAYVTIVRPQLNCWDMNNNRVCDTETEDTNGDGSCTVEDCRMPVILSGKDFSHKNLANSKFVSANLSGADFHCANVSVTDFASANLSAANFSINPDYCSDSPTNLSASNLSRSNCAGANFYGATVAGANFAEAALSAVNFANANLTGANFVGAVLSGVDFSHANLVGASFTGATLSGILWHDTTCPDGVTVTSTGSCAGRGGGL